MPSKDRYDTTINCTPDDLTLINRGPIKARVLCESQFEPKASYFVELRLGRRRARTAITEYYDHETMVRDLLTMLGFEAEVTTGPIDWDDDYGADDKEGPDLVESDEH
jgi:hypothetical protein